MIRHHPASGILGDYARGALGAGDFLVVACHLDACEICRSEVRLWENVCGVLLDRLQPSPMQKNAQAIALAKLDDSDAATAIRQDVLPAYLSRFSIPGPLGRRSLPPRLWVAPGIWLTPLELEAGSSHRTYLMFARRGTVMPEHLHGGREFTLVIHGSFSDRSGVYAKGDFAETNECVVHSPAVPRDSDCLCLISSDAPMLLKSWPARFLQRVLRNPY
jgi:putative transcriptional regulator